MTSPRDIFDAFERALGYIEAGWIQGYLRRWGETGPTHYCLHGALAAATPGWPTYMVLCDAIGERLWAGRARGNLVRWNDCPGRTKGQVIRAIRLAQYGYQEDPALAGLL